MTDEHRQIYFDADLKSEAYYLKCAFDSAIFFQS